jgi:diphthine synthase
MFSKYFTHTHQRKRAGIMGQATGSLTFIGLGLYDTQDLSLRGLRRLHDADVVFAEFYTSRSSGFDAKSFAQHIDKPITVLSREQTERADEILTAAQTKHVALLVSGDPMTATTHVDLRLRAAKAGIPTYIIHASSIFTAAPGLLGLQAYKFGRSTTLAFPQQNFFPTSPYDVIVSNYKAGLHTLVFLDIQAEQNKYMTASDGLRLIMEMGQRLNDATITDETVACVVARAGSESPVVAADQIKALISRDFGPPLHILVIPGTLHFIEVEALIAFAGLPPKLGRLVHKL